MGLNASKVITHQFNTLFPTSEKTKYKSNIQKNLNNDDLIRMANELHSCMPWFNDQLETEIIINFLDRLRANIKHSTNEIHSRLDDYLETLCEKFPGFHGNHKCNDSIINVLIDCYYHFSNIISMSESVFHNDEMRSFSINIYRRKRDIVFSCLQKMFISKSIDDLRRDQKEKRITLLSSIIVGCSGDLKIPIPHYDKKRLLATINMIVYKQRIKIKKNNDMIESNDFKVILRSIEIVPNIDEASKKLDDLENEKIFSHSVGINTDAGNKYDPPAAGGGYVSLPKGGVYIPSTRDSKSVKFCTQSEVLNDEPNTTETTPLMQGVQESPFNCMYYVKDKETTVDKEPAKQAGKSAEQDGESTIVEEPVKQDGESTIVEEPAKQAGEPAKQDGESTIVEEPAKQAGEHTVVDESFKKLEKFAEGDQINDNESDVSGSSNETEDRTNVIISGSGTGNKKKRKGKGKGNK